MLGYRLGFALAAVIAALFAGLVWQLAEFNRLTPTTSVLTEASAMDPLTIEVPAESVYKSESPGDAGQLYREAADLVRPGRFLGYAQDYAALLRETSPEPIEAAEAVQRLIKAGPMAGDILFAADPKSLVDYNAGTESIDALALAGQCLGRAAMLRLAKEPDKAKTLFEAQFSLGWKLFGERLRYAEAAAGLSLARDAVAGLREVAARAGDTRRAALLATFDRSAASLQAKRLDPVWAAVGSVDGRVIETHAGDVYALTGRDNRERLWRIESILALGKHRFNVGRDADQLIVPRRLAELEAGETDSMILTAITAAKHLTLEQFRTVR
jgi:hypothetical protein